MSPLAPNAIAGREIQNRQGRQRDRTAFFRWINDWQFDLLDWPDVATLDEGLPRSATVSLSQSGEGGDGVMAYRSFEFGGSSLRVVYNAPDPGAPRWRFVIQVRDFDTQVLILESQFVLNDPSDEESFAFVLTDQTKRYTLQWITSLEIGQTEPQSNTVTTSYTFIPRP